MLALRHGIQILPPEVNLSSGNFSIEGETLVRVYARNLKHAEQTRSLLSLLTDISRDKFIHLSLIKTELI